MATVNDNEVFNLSDIQHKLGVEQHKLIHLCEKGVVVPDFEDSAGRGTMRRFSERNLFEFAVALELRRFFLPVSYIAPIIQVLRAFETYAAHELKVFSLPKSLQQKPQVGLRLLIVEGDLLFFGLRHHRESTFIGGLSLAKISKPKPSVFGQVDTLKEDPSLGTSSHLALDLNKIAASIG